MTTFLSALLALVTILALRGAGVEVDMLSAILIGVVSALAVTLVEVLR